jgi:hypothetical protein
MPQNCRYYVLRGVGSRFSQSIRINGLRPGIPREYRDSRLSKPQGLRTKITEEVLDMITIASHNTRRPADFALPMLRCADAAWLRALPEFMGEVSAQGTSVKGGVRVNTADVRTFPGTTAWSPPT